MNKYAGNAAQKMESSIQNFLVNVNILQNTANLFTFTKEIFNQKIRFLCSGNDGFVKIY